MVSFQIFKMFNVCLFVSLVQLSEPNSIRINHALDDHICRFVYFCILFYCFFQIFLRLRSENHGPWYTYFVLA